MAFSRIYAEIAKLLLDRKTLRDYDIRELEMMYGDAARDAIDALVAAGAAKRVGSRVEAVDLDKLRRIARMR